MFWRWKIIFLYLGKRLLRNKSRFYRAPEILLGVSYGYPIDMWSFGCIMMELYTGTPLLPSENEKEHMSMILEILGMPPL